MAAHASGSIRIVAQYIEWVRDDYDGRRLKSRYPGKNLGRQSRSPARQVVSPGTIVAEIRNPFDSNGSRDSI